MQQFYLLSLISQHVSGIYMPIFRSTDCILLHMVLSTVKENYALVGGFILCCSLWCVIVG